MIFRTLFSLLFPLLLLSAPSLAEQFKQAGYVEILDPGQSAAGFDALYRAFDECSAFFQKNRAWANTLKMAKERFLRSKEKTYYATDFFGLYDESEIPGRCQISFYYSSHFHEFLFSRYPEFALVPEISHFFASCLSLQKPYGALFKSAALELGMEAIFPSEGSFPPLLLKVVKYLPGYTPAKPHYDGTVFSLFLDSTDNALLLLSPYKSSFAVDDFFSPLRKFPRGFSLLLIPGTLLTGCSIDPIPHIVLESGKTRYAAIAFALRPHFAPPKREHSPLPNF